MAQQDGHKTSSGEDYNRGAESIRHHGSMERKHFTHVVLHIPCQIIKFCT